LHFAAQNENRIDALNQNGMDKPQPNWKPGMIAAIAALAAKASAWARFSRARTPYLAWQRQMPKQTHAVIH
jgi:hypothetical protein